MTPDDGEVGGQLLRRVHGQAVTPLPEQRERMTKLEGFLAGRRDRDAA